MKPSPEFRTSFLKAGLLLMLAALVGACSGRGDVQDEEAMSAEEFQRSQESQARVEELNEQLLLMAVESGADGADVYRVGPEDRLEFRVFGVEDLSGEVRVAGNGTVQLPLVGEVKVSGLTLAEVEDAIAAAYADGYVRNPQVSASVSEYRSQQFTLIGAVEEPRVYSVQRKTSLVEAVAMGGGLNEEAGQHIYLRDRVRDPESGQMGTRSLVVPIEELMDNPAELNVVLGESAIINVPRAGMVYVEGAVNRPGVYPQLGSTTILKAIAQAGGLKFEADNSRIKVVRREGPGNEWAEQYYDIGTLREGPQNDVALADGDVVVVETSAIKTAFRESSRWVTAILIVAF